MSFIAGYLLGLEDSGGGSTTTADIIDIIDSQEPLATMPLVKDYWCKLSSLPDDVILYPKIQVSYSTFNQKNKPLLSYKSVEKRLWKEYIWSLYKDDKMVYVYAFPTELWQSEDYWGTYTYNADVDYPTIYHSVAVQNIYFDGSVELSIYNKNYSGWTIAAEMPFEQKRVEYDYYGNILNETTSQQTRTFTTIISSQNTTGFTYTKCSADELADLMTDFQDGMFKAYLETI